MTNGTDWWTFGVAAYAAVVGTGALFLEIRRWSEEGVHLAISIMPDARLISVAGFEAEPVLAVTVTNRGDAPTTITHLGLESYPTWWSRIRRRPAGSWFVPNPGAVGDTPLPRQLDPGSIWHGFAKHQGDLPAQIASKHLYVAIYASHSDRSTLKRVVPAQKPPADATKL